MAAVRNALVIGGGIGGLTAGIALRRAGIPVDLVEISPTFSVYGVGIIQPNNVLRALDRIGLAVQCCEHGTPFPGWRIFNAEGSLLMEAPNGNSAAPRFPPNNGITRPVLQRILKDAAYMNGVEISLGTKVDRLENLADGVRVELSDGRSSTYDIVIACDGLYSATRRDLFGDAVAPQFAGGAVWRYNLPRPPDLEWGEIYSGATTRVGLTPLSSDLMYMFLVSAEPGNPRMPADRLAEFMRERLEGYDGRIPALRRQIVDSALVVYKPMEQMLLPAPWYKGRIILIGDAVHATTPHLAQGAAMAIEDAVLLGELLGCDTSVQDVLRQFMERRFNRAKLVVDSSGRIVDWEMEAWQGIHNPDARPGETLHETSMALLEEY